ncbi:MAG: quinoprotein glucose dehydrogenase, partial [Bacteroidia bacterium]
GLGLPSRYKQHFFLSDYGFAASRSLIWSFALNPKGAGFEMVDTQQFATNELFIDQDFGYDGKLYAISAPVFGGKKRIRTFFDPSQQGSPEVTEVGQLFSDGFGKLTDPRLLELLAHADQRVRQHAQFELVKRKRGTALNAIAINGEAAELARIHALWGLGQLRAQLIMAGWGDLSQFQGEVLAQALKVIGEAGVSAQRDSVRANLSHSSPRVQYFAAKAAGKLQDTQAVNDLMQLADGAAELDDPFLRHALVWALAEIGDHRAVKLFMKSESLPRRMASLLVLRRWRDADIAVFLKDTEPSLVVEAARAIYDLPISDAIPALAALASTNAPLQADDPQSAHALHRRILHSAVMMGGEIGADYLMRYAANDANTVVMREHALDAFKHFTQPPKLDAVVGWYRPINERPDSIVYAAIDEWVPVLLKGDMGETALAVAAHYNRVPLPDDQLLVLILNHGEKLTNRISALEALKQRRSAIASGNLKKAVDIALQSDETKLQAVALSVLAEIDPQRAVSLAIEFAATRQGLFLQQQAISMLGRVKGATAEEWLAGALEKLAARRHTSGTGLELIAAAEQFDSKLIREKLAQYRVSIPAGDVVEARHTTLVGGDPVKGKMKFQTGGDCLRCHAVSGNGGNAGPDLAGIASLHNERYLLEAMVTPGSAIAPGFGHVSLTLNDGSTVTGILMGETNEHLKVRAHSSHGEGEPSTILKSETQSQDGPISGMPPMGLVLPDADVRDIMAYLKTLK